MVVLGPAFRLGDDLVIVAPADEGDAATSHTVRVIPEPEPESATPTIAVDTPIPSPRRRFLWGTLFWCAAGGLMLLAIGLAVAGLIEDLFARSQELACQRRRRLGGPPATDERR